MLWAEEAARAEPRGENELGRSEEQREPCGSAASWVQQAERSWRRVYDSLQVTGRHPFLPESHGRGSNQGR